VQHCLKEFSAKDKIEWLQSFLDKLKVNIYFFVQTRRIFLIVKLNLKGRYVILSTNRSGSFVMETIWSIATLKQRIFIADELKASEVQLKNDG